MSEKKKGYWFRLVVDFMVLLIFAMLAWAGSVLWEISKTQAVIVSTQAGTTVMQEAILKRTGELELWKAETAGNRFTSEDGMELWIELKELKEYVVSLPLGEPPVWLIERMNMLSERITDLEHRLNGIHQ